MSREVNCSNDVLVDMDNVTADFDKAVLDRLPQHIVRVARMNFYIHQDYPEFEDEVHKITRNLQFFHTLPVVEYALDGWQRIIDAGFFSTCCVFPVYHK